MSTTVITVRLFLTFSALDRFNRVSARHVLTVLRRPRVSLADINQCPSTSSSRPEKIGACALAAVC